MILTLTIAATMAASPPASWQMGGGQTWVNPPGRAGCTQERFTCAANAFRQDDMATTIAELQIAAREGDARAMKALGLMLRGGIGVAANRELGEYWLRRAAEQR